jgi:hypothetical protein
MIQKLISGGWQPFNLNNNSFSSLHGPHSWSPISPTFTSVSLFAAPGTLRKFRMRTRRSDGTPFAPAAGESFTITTRKAGVDTSLLVAVDENSYDAVDLSNSVAISAGDLIDLKCVPGGSPSTDRYPLWSYEFESDNAGESVYFVTGGLWYKNQATGYFTLIPDASNPYANTVAQVQQVIAAAGVIKDLYLELDTNPGAGAEAYRMTLMLNGSPTSLTVTITGAATSGTDLANEVTVAPGDLVCWKKEALNSPTNNVSARAGFVFEADTDGQSLFLNGYKTALNTGAVRYYPLNGNLRAYDADEFKQQQYCQILSISDLYSIVSAAPGAGKSWTFRVMKNGVGTALVIVIEDSATTGNDTDNLVRFYDDDLIDLEITPSGTPAAAHASFGALQTLGAKASRSHALFVG